MTDFIEVDVQVLVFFFFFDDFDGFHASCYHPDKVLEGYETVGSKLIKCKVPKYDYVKYFGQET